jgi:hypothetical protein
MSTEPLRTVKDRLSEFVDRAQREHDRVTITRNGVPAAVLGFRRHEGAAIRARRVPASRAIAERLPEPVAAAVIDLITGPLLTDPKVVGEQWRRELAGIRSARPGTFRALCRIDEATTRSSCSESTTAATRTGRDERVFRLGSSGRSNGGLDGGRSTPDPGRWRRSPAGPGVGAVSSPVLADARPGSRHRVNDSGRSVDRRARGRP